MDLVSSSTHFITNCQVSFKKAERNIKDLFLPRQVPLSSSPRWTRASTTTDTSVTVSLKCHLAASLYSTVLAQSPRDTRSCVAVWHLTDNLALHFDVTDGEFWTRWTPGPPCCHSSAGPVGGRRAAEAEGGLSETRQSFNNN